MGLKHGMLLHHYHHCNDCANRHRIYGAATSHREGPAGKAAAAVAVVYTCMTTPSESCCPCKWRGVPRSSVGGVWDPAELRAGPTQRTLLQGPYAAFYWKMAQTLGAFANMLRFWHFLLISGSVARYTRYLPTIWPPLFESHFKNVLNSSITYSITKCRNSFRFCPVCHGV
jgi:hypothetical protein